MPNVRAELIVHPVRLRILTIIAGQTLTPQQIGKALPDVAQATLYRHINKLVEGGLLTVVQQNQVRGAVEKVYALADPRLMSLGPEDMAALTKEDHVRYFTVFVTTLLSEFSRYVEETAQPDMLADGVGYRTIPVYLSDEDLIAFSKALNAALLPFLKRGPGENRRRRLFSTVLLPADDPAADD